MSGERIVNREKLSSYSAVLSILVIMIHTENIGNFPVASDMSFLGRLTYFLEQFLSGDVAKIGVPSFFMFSGLLFYRDFQWNKYPQKMKSRFFSLMIPYLLWNLFRFSLLYIMGKVPFVEDVLHINRVVFTPENFLEGVFFYKYNLGYWFMYQLILYTILCPIIYLLLKNRLVALFSLGILFFLFSTDALGEISITIFHKKFLQIDGLFYYMLGGFVGMHCFDIVNLKGSAVTRLAVLGAVLGQVFFVLYQITHALAFHILFCTVSAISFWYLFDSIIKKPLSKQITAITFFIYSAHGTILEIFQAANQILFPNTSFTALAEYLLLPCITLLMLVLISLFLKRHAGWLWKIVNGSR